MYPIKYDEKTVQAAIDRVYEQISPLTENTVFLVLMNGGVWFAHELFRRFHDIPLEVYYAKASSYSGKQQGELNITYMPEVDYIGKHVIVLDDICDSGHTIEAFYNYLKAQNAASISFATLIYRVGASSLSKEIHLVSGIEDASGDFFVGCGLDDNNQARNLPYIGTC